MKIEALRTIERIPSRRRDMERPLWPAGPWDSEPDLVEWRDAATGYPCLVVRGPTGALCGYVGVPPEHPYSGKPYSEVDDHVPAHGGLTFSDSCHEDGSICHVPLPGEPDAVWWFGFDCAHSGDVTPGLIRHYQEAAARYGIPPESWHLHDTYKTLAYVQAEVTTLAAELKRLA